MLQPLTIPIPGVAPTIQSLIGYHFPQSPHIVIGKCFAQFGHTAWFWNVSNGCMQRSHCHFSPNSGAVRQLGHINPGRRGSFDRRIISLACLNPFQQFRSTKTAIAPIQKDCRKMDRPLAFTWHSSSLLPENYMRPIRRKAHVKYPGFRLDAGCPILVAFLFLPQGWDSTNPNSWRLESRNRYAGYQPRHQFRKRPDNVFVAARSVRARLHRGPHR